MKRTRSLPSIASLLALTSLVGGLAACGAADPTDLADSEAESASGSPITDSGKADVVTLTGQFTAKKTAFADGDIRDLAIYASTNMAQPASTYVRLRCYGWKCAHPIPEVDTIQKVVTSTRTYFQFMSWKYGAPDQSGNATVVPVVADTYEYRALGKTGFQLRKTFTSRWLTYAPATNLQLCGGSGGHWKLAVDNADGFTNCDCSAIAGGGFVAGAGGCIHMSISSEAACDGTQGQYTDDDQTRIGTYCTCGIGRYMTDAGCAAIPR